MERQRTEIEGCRIAHQRLRAMVGGLGDPDFSGPSQLPGWSVGHVLTHIARNAEAMCRRLEAAVRSELLEQYEGGSAGRAADVEVGSQREPTEIREDVISWSIRLDDVFESVPDKVWGRPVRTVVGDEHPAALLPFRRWREVEVHLVDLGLGVGPADWTDGLVHRALPGLVAGLPDRADQRELMAWLLGRGPAPDLPEGIWDLVARIREQVDRAICELAPPDRSFVFTNVVVESDPMGQRTIERVQAVASLGMPATYPFS